MYKIKTLRAASKRFKKTATGLYKHKHSSIRHILTKKNMKRKRHLRKKAIVSSFYLNKVKKCLPYL